MYTPEAELIIDGQKEVFGLTRYKGETQATLRGRSSYTTKEAAEYALEYYLANCTGLAKKYPNNYLAVYPELRERAAWQIVEER